MRVTILTQMGKGNVKRKEGRDPHQEHDGRDIFETVNPLSAFRSLAAHVNHPENNRLEVKGILNNPGGRDTDTQPVGKTDTVPEEFVCRISIFSSRVLSSSVFV